MFPVQPSDKAFDENGNAADKEAMGKRAAVFNKRTAVVYAGKG
jgi:hypothetical protein